MCSSRIAIHNRQFMVHTDLDNDGDEVFQTQHDLKNGAPVAANCLTEIKDLLHNFELSSKLLFKRLLKRINDIENPKLAGDRHGDETDDRPSTGQGAKTLENVLAENFRLKSSLEDSTEREAALKQKLERLTRSEVKLIEDVSRLSESQTVLRNDLLKADQSSHLLRMRLALAVGKGQLHANEKKKSKDDQKLNCIPGTNKIKLQYRNLHLRYVSVVC